MRLAVVVVLGGCHWAFGISEQPLPDAPPPGRWENVAISARHACAIDSDRQLYCWGDPANGRLGTATSGLTPQLVVGGPWSAVATGRDHTCALDTTGRAWCWGKNAFGQVTGDPGSDQPAPMLVGMPIDAPVFTAIATSAVGSCALGAGKILCWGDPGSAKGSSSTSHAPEEVGAGGFTQLAMGFDHACALAGDVTWCWGSNGSAQTGQPKSDQAMPAIVGIGPATAISAGFAASCAVLATGEVWCWGGSAAVSTAYLPTPPGRVLAGGYAQVVVGTNLACAIADGQATCWGSPVHGGLGDGHFTETVAPAAVATKLAVDVLALSAAVAGEESGCAITNHELACWGDNRGGQLGSPATLHPTPVLVPGNWRALAVGADHTCAAADGHALSCWGSNDAGQATGTPGADVATPTTPAIASATDEIVTGNSFTCVRSGTTIDCFGSNAHGAMRSTDPNAHTAQVLLPGSSPQQLLGGGGGVCISNPLTCWGHIMPVGDQPSAATPKDPNALVGDATIAQFGFDASCIIKTDQRRVCWGYQFHGQLGDSTDPMGNPMPVDPIVIDQTKYADLAYTSQHACAARADGPQGIWCWGTNYSGESGAVSTVGVASVPLVVSNASAQLAKCTAVSASALFSCGICDGRVSCWGSNIGGELGRGNLDRTADNVAVEVSLSGGQWTRVHSGTDHACAIANDGGLACWGLSVRGQLGDGSHGSAVPVAIAHP